MNNQARYILQGFSTLFSYGNAAQVQAANAEILSMHKSLLRRSSCSFIEEDKIKIAGDVKKVMGILGLPEK